jgi:alkylation response protein AidB-like acyl-CoA dehydrogenase
MSILYDEGQQAIANESRRILEAHVATEALLPLLETQGAIFAPFWTIAREQGWTAVALPEAYGGLGLGLVELGLVALQAGRSLSGAPFLTASFGTARAILDHGDEALKQQWLPRLASGDAIGAVAFMEGQQVIGRDLAFRDGKLSGTKSSAIGGTHADVAIVTAGDGGELLLAVVDLADARRQPIESFDNSRCAADLIFADTPATVLARGAEAEAAAFHILALQAVVTAHEQTGGAEKLLETARDYALTRRAFGQPIGAFQSVKHRIAEIYALVELARAGALHAAAREGQDDFITAAASARIQATDSYDTAARDCVQIHGGIGVTWEAGLHLHMRRARSLAIEQGNLFFWEDVLVDRLREKAA